MQIQIRILQKNFIFDLLAQVLQILLVYLLLFFHLKQSEELVNKFRIRSFRIG